MSRYQRHLFVCLNEREPNHPKGCCLHKGSAEVRDKFKDELKKRGSTLKASGMAESRRKMLRRLLIARSSRAK